MGGYPSPLTALLQVPMCMHGKHAVRSPCATPLPKWEVRRRMKKKIAIAHISTTVNILAFFLTVFSLLSLSDAVGIIVHYHLKFFY